MTLRIGIDVGGTHADGVLLDGHEVLAKKKILVDQSRLDEVILTLLSELLPFSGTELASIHLSTTLCTNAVVNDTLEPVGMLLQAGPGMNPDFLQCGPHLVFCDGAIDHRGQVVKKPDLSRVDAAATRFEDAGIGSVAVVTKFSQRNNSHEKVIAERLAHRFASISMGHRISGLANFPRRVYTTWLNAALTRQFTRFQRAITHGLEQLGVSCSCVILKADGGTMPFTQAASLPCQTVLSGPAASIMGCLALHSCDEDAILLDIGGTTTDIALLADGVPLFAPYGATIQGRPTLIRALYSKSVGLGGDSAVSLMNGDFVIGPERRGVPRALGGPVATPTDAMVTLGYLEAGERHRAIQSMTELVPDSAPRETAQRLLVCFAAQIKEAVAEMIDEVFSRPVFTVAALLNRTRLQPRQIIAVGGPAQALQQVLADCFAAACVVPDHFEVANAVGAARTRPTFEATLYADTAAGSLSLPERGILESISGNFTVEAARQRLRAAMAEMACEAGLRRCPEVEFTEEQVMQTVRGFATSGQVIALKAQIRPRLTASKENL